jgi:hypothetical protein
MLTRIDQKFKGHYICAEYCQFFLTTDVGDYRISTLGEMRYPDKERLLLNRMSDAWEEIGCERTYETMTFSIGNDVTECDCGTDDCPNGQRNIDVRQQHDFRGYNYRGDAIAGHEELVALYLSGHTPPEQERYDGDV